MEKFPKLIDRILVKFIPAKPGTPESPLNKILNHQGKGLVALLVSRKQ